MTSSAVVSQQQGVGVLASPDLADDPDVFPLLPGESWPAKTPLWSTTLLTSKSGRVFRRQNWSYPIWQFQVSYASLSQKPSRRDMDRLWAFFNRRAGQFANFYYYDPSDNAVTGQPIGVGDGVTRQFQMIRSFQTWNEPVFAFNGSPVMTVGGLPVGTFQMIAPGVVEFDVAPGAGKTVAWSGSFMFLCHFTQDDLSTQQLDDHIFSNDGLSFESVKL